MPHSLFTSEERIVAEAIARIVYCNPFLPERIALERQALRERYLEADLGWNVWSNSEGHAPNVTQLTDRVEAILAEVRQRMTCGKMNWTAADLTLYADIVCFLLYHRYYDPLTKLIEQSSQQAATRIHVGFWSSFAADFDHFLGLTGIKFPETTEPAHLLACFFQVRRAFQQIFRYIVGASEAICRLRATVWQSIFTHDMRRYRRSLYDRMGDITTLITGPSGTGKELVARAIGLTRYIPFDSKTRTFAENFAVSFHALNVSALSSTLIESELFGHRRGSFTGAIEDRIGWLEQCRPSGSVFLDEIGDLDPLIQVKLLRVLQNKTFQRLGETEMRVFGGKIIAATNRNLATQMRLGEFREDFYYRLCADMIVTPSLREQLRDGVEERRRLVRYIARRIAPEEADRLTEEVDHWLAQNVDEHYAWPGNFRELEQCVRNVLIRGEYHPSCEHGDDAADFTDAIRAASLTADELLQRYIALVYEQCGSYEATARRLKLDRRTVKAKLGKTTGASRQFQAPL